MASAGLTLKEFVKETWAPLHQNEVVPKTWKIYRHVYNKHIYGQLGDRAIARLDSEDLVEWHDGLRRAGIGAATQVKAINLLNLIFEEAGRRGRSTGVTLNPVSMLRRPGTGRKRIPRPWGPVVVEGVRRRLLRESGRRGRTRPAEQARLQDVALVSVMYMAGLRPGEALALRWRDVAGDRIHVRSAMSDGEIVERTKTRTEREVPIIGPLQEDLDGLRALSGAGADDFLFRTRKGEHFSENDWKL